jgi:hypothetical protein
VTVEDTLPTSPSSAEPPGRNAPDACCGQGAPASVGSLLPGDERAIHRAHALLDNLDVPNGVLEERIAWLARDRAIALDRAAEAVRLLRDLGIDLSTTPQEDSR